MKTDFILILDFGSQFTQLIARRTRELKVYSEIHPYNLDIHKFLKDNPSYNLKGVILSGGPASVLAKDSPHIKKEHLDYFIEEKIPVLGVCYGLQLLVYLYGGKIHASTNREYGHSIVRPFKKTRLFNSIEKKQSVWMSHGDSIDSIPKEFRVTSKNEVGVVSSFECKKLNLYGIQFHAEVNHTVNGAQILKNFIFGICKVKNLFKYASFIENKIREIRENVGNDKAICALSGGVDSSVAAVLVQKAIGKKLICVHIDNGLMRKEESKKIIKTFRENFDLNVKFVNASEVFLKKLKGVIDPEKKRKIIGKTFIDVFEKEAKKYKNIKYLIQGTLYPDVIESVSFKGPSVTIKSHHNVGGLPKKMHLKLIEPFRELFKDEVREIGKKLGIPQQFIGRHPFPGPGLAIRVISDVSEAKLKLLRDVDDIFITELRTSKLYDKIWQAFAVLLPVQSVGVMGDERSYENVIALRAVTSKDGMTSDFFQFDKEFLSRVSNKIINKVKGVNRVVYDISSKPPATIEWE